MRAPILAATAALLFPAAAHAQLLGKIRERVAEVADRMEDAHETAGRYGAAVLPITTEQERTIGHGIAATVAGHYGVVRDPELSRYVNLVGAVVADRAPPRDGIEYAFAVLDTDEVNAFAAPGGWIFVTRGAISAMEDEATLAAVLAHEVGHVVARDVIDEIRDKARTRLGVEEAAEAVDVAGEEFLVAAVETGATALFMGLSRDDEMAADEFAIRAAAAAGYDPRGLGRFLATLAELAGDDETSLLEQTHPDPADRRRKAEIVVRSLGDSGPGVAAADRFRARTAPAAAGR
jgi:predicted Zn-dependent protease